jgi:hypothetical protein
MDHNDIARHARRVHSANNFSNILDKAVAPRNATRPRWTEHEDSRQATKADLLDIASALGLPRATGALLSVPGLRMLIRARLTALATAEGAKAKLCSACGARMDAATGECCDCPPHNAGERQMTSTTIESLTLAQVRALYTAAGQAGDTEMVDDCTVAKRWLGEVKAGQTRRTPRAVERVLTALNDAAAQENEHGR